MFEPMRRKPKISPQLKFTQNWFVESSSARSSPPEGVEGGGLLRAHSKDVNTGSAAPSLPQPPPLVESSSLRNSPQTSSG